MIDNKESSWEMVHAHREELMKTRKERSDKGRKRGKYAPRKPKSTAEAYLEQRTPADMAAELVVEDIIN